MTAFHRPVECHDTDFSAPELVLGGGSDLRHHRYLISPDEQAARYYLTRLFVPYRRRSRVIGTMADVAPMATLKILSIFDGKPPPGGVAGPLGGDRDELQDVAGQVLRHADIDTAQLTTIALAARPPEGGRSMIFLISRQTGELVALIKIASEDRQRANLRHTHQKLRHLRSRLAGSWLSAVPTPLALCELPPYTATVESGLPGRSLYVAANLARDHGRHLGRHFDLASQFAVGFHQETTTAVVPFSEQHIEQFIRAPEKAYCDLTHPPAQLREFGERLAEQAAGLKGLDIPMVCLHGDYWARNLLEQDGSLRAVDWEHMNLQAPPFADWFMFCLSYGEMIGAGQTALQHAFSPTGAIYSHARKFILTCCTQMGVDKKMLPVFLAAFLLERATSDNGHRTNRWRRAYEECATRWWDRGVWGE